MKSFSNQKPGRALRKVTEEEKNSIKEIIRRIATNVIRKIHEINVNIHIQFFIINK